MPKPSTRTVAVATTAIRMALAAVAACALAGCFGTDMSGISGSLGALTAPTSQPRAVPVFVASTRPAFSGDRLGAPTRERARFYRQIVTVPPGHQVGTIPRPSLTPESPSRHFTLADRAALTPDDFRGELARAIAAKPADQRDVLVYVHGFNT
ncbi:MAG: hypothetical protein ACRCVA_12500, partial [Phreatobacter sp.]